MLDEQRAENSRCIRAAAPATVFPVSCRPRPTLNVVAVKPALQHPNVTLLTDTYVKRIETSATGREAREVVRREGETERYCADIVVFACGAINSAALLLRSANAMHPDGLANRRRRAALHVSQQLGADRDLTAAKPDPLPE
jgi:choline dehydrogenase-like flavoprotein